MNINKTIDKYLTEKQAPFPAGIKAKIEREAPIKIAKWMKANPKKDAEEYAFSVVQDMAPYDILELQGGEELVASCHDEAEAMVKNSEI